MLESAKWTSATRGRYLVNYEVMSVCGRLDIALKVDGTTKVCIELKRPREALDASLPQALNYLIMMIKNGEEER